MAKKSQTMFVLGSDTFQSTTNGWFRFDFHPQ